MGLVSSIKIVKQFDFVAHVQDGTQLHAPYRLEVDTA